MIAGRYTLLREIGRGASGVVWLAEDEALGRNVAMKRHVRSADAYTEGRAWREARVAAGLHHPHLVAVYDLVEDDDDLWLVMEYVAGGTLAEAVAAAGPYEPSEAARVGLEVADGLACAHDAGIVHRDVKPSNILLGHDLQAKLADFGIARGTGVDATLTQTGTLHGSPAYLAPEVAAGGPATALSDVWSLGASLFHALTGSPPYSTTDGNVVGVLYRIVHDPVPRTDRAGWLTPMLVGAMTRELAQRWTMTQVRDFLRAGPPGDRSGARRSTVAVPATDMPMTDPSATAVLPAVVTQPLGAPSGLAPPPVTPSHLTPSHLPPSHVTPSPGPGRGGRSRRLRAVPAFLLLAVVIVLMAVWLWPDSGTTSPPTSSTSTTTTSTASTEAAITAFVQTYVATAPVDQARAFAMLTPQYQQASGGLAGYRAFWGSVSGVQMAGAVRVGTGTKPTATYTYSYTRPTTGRVTETVTLDLVHATQGFLIDGATARRR